MYFFGTELLFLAFVRDSNCKSNSKLFLTSILIFDI